MNEDPHEICRVKTDVAVQEERGKATAMALVLAEKLSAADRKFLLACLAGSVGWIFALLAGIAIALVKR